MKTKRHSFRFRLWNKLQGINELRWYRSNLQISIRTKSSTVRIPVKANRLFTISLSAALVMSILLSCSDKKDKAGPQETNNNATNVLAAVNLKAIGRFEIADQKLELIGTASNFEVSFEGKTCAIIASIVSYQDHNYIQYELDGTYQKKLSIKGGGKTDSLTIDGLADGPHKLRVFKVTEATTGPVYIHRLVAKNVKPIDIAALPVIEFIGNSITCGAGSDTAEFPCGTGITYLDQHNGYKAYGPTLARMLNTNFIVSSVSGIGMYRNWNSDGPTMPQVYDKLDLKVTSTRTWNYQKYSPKIVSIALGTNDFSNGDGTTPRLAFDSVAFTRTYVDFAKNIKTKYPNTNIVLINSPMITGTKNQIYKDCLERVKSRVNKEMPNGRPVNVFFFTSTITPHGCGGHPNTDEHQQMAEQLRPYFKTLIDL